MTPDEARDLFSEAFEGELEPARRTAFEATLASDAELADEYAVFCDALRATRSVSLEPGAHVDLLGGVQSKLRKRSRGRFYRDRFARLRPSELVLPIALALLCLLLFGIAFAGLHLVRIESPTAHEAPT